MRVNKKRYVLPIALAMGITSIAAPVMAARVNNSVDLSVTQQVNAAVPDSKLPNPYGALDSEYVMHVGDIFTMEVFDYREISRDGGTQQGSYKVRTDGYVNMPLIGPVYCVGKTIDQLSYEVRLRYTEFIKKPDITINLQAMGSIRIYVLGEINGQGMYELDKSHRLMDAIAAAHGFTEYSAKTKVFVIRRGNQEASFKVDFNQLLKTGNPQVNVELYEGDCVYLTSNNKFSFSKDIAPWVSAVSNVADMRYKVRNY